MSWAYKMYKYLLEHGYWIYVEGVNDATPDSTCRDFPAWKDAWKNLKRIFVASIMAKKLQLRQGLNNIRHRDIGSRLYLQVQGDL